MNKRGTKRRNGPDQKNFTAEQDRKRGFAPAVSSRACTIAAICLILVFGLQAVLAMQHLSATSDEAVHLASGYSYWETRDFRMNPEHPPLAKLIAALPLLVIRPQLDTSTDAWKNSQQYEFGFDFLYHNDADRLLFWSRLPMVGLAVLGAILTFMWSRDLFGPMAAVLAVGLYAFSPNLLAHGMLITTDVSAGVFTLLTLYLFWKQGERPAWWSSLVTGLALGLAMTSKYSGGLLPLLIVGFSCLRVLGHSERKQAALAEVRTLMIMAAASFFVIEAVYLFAASPILYFKNAAFVNANHNPTYAYYLLGQLKEGGWWYYFLIAFIFKATLPTLILIALATTHGLAGFLRRRGEIILLAAIGFHVAIVSAGAHNLGIRYLLPIFPLLFIWASRIVTGYWPNRWGRVLLVMILGWQMWAALSAFPNYIPYFNELAGGAGRGTDILDDSNVDWGQAWKQAGAYVKEKGIDNATLYSFSPFDNPPYYGLPANVPAHQIAARLQSKPPVAGTYIISGHYVARMKAMYPTWRSYQPVDRIGESLWVYRFQ